MPDQTVLRTLLFDFYGELLTPKQREYFDLHYNNDLSLAEIAESCGVTRQAVWDIIRRAELALYETEEKTGLVRRYGAQRGVLAEMEENLRALQPLVHGEALRRTEALLRELSELKGSIYGV